MEYIPDNLINPTVLTEAQYHDRLHELGVAPRTIEELSPAQAYFLSCDKKYVWFCAGRGCGKCVAKGTRFLLFSGKTKAVEDLVVGDVLMGWDNTPRPIISLARGEDEMYEIKPTKGESHIVNSHHILTLKHHQPSRGKDEVYDIPLMEYLKIKDTKKGKLSYLFRMPIEYSESKTLLDPYIAGLWLGDGTYSAPELTSQDQVIIDAWDTYFQHTFPHLVRNARHQGNGTWRIRYTGQKGGVRIQNPFMVHLEPFKVTGEKRIPYEYLVNSRARRLELLAGLIDTDGHMYGNMYEIATKGDGLKDDILYLARSLGLAAYAKVKMVKIPNKDERRPYWRITISGDTDMVPVKLERKKCQPRQQIKNALHTGFKVIPVGRDDYYGFTVEGDGRVVLADFTVTHNTHIGARWVYRKILSEPTVKGLICANTYDQLHSATLPPLFDYLNGMGMEFVVDKRPPEEWGLKQNRTNYRNVMTLRNGKTIFLRSLDQPEYIRGIEVGWIWIDEISSSTKDAFDIVIGCLRDKNAKQLDVRVTGTPDGDNWTWREFRKKWSDEVFDDGSGTMLPVKDFYEIIFMSTRDNPFLTKEFVQGMLAAYDPRKAAQEVDGRVVLDQDAAIYYAYNSEFHDRLVTKYNPMQPVMLCIDFNAGGEAPMCALVAQQHQYKDGTPYIQVLHEFVIPDGNTPKICEAFTRAFLGHIGGVRIYGDSQGLYRAATVGINDYKLMQQYLERVFTNVTFHVPDKQANEVNRTAALNAMMQNAHGDVRCFINPACKDLLADLRELRPDDKGKINKKDPMRSHLSDALTYYVSVDFPVGAFNIDFDLPHNLL